MKTVGIIQPNYIPWRGLFDFIYEVDIFVFLDDVQYTVRDWRSRNKIKNTSGEALWLTVPVVGGRNQLIKDVCIDNTQSWARKHLGALRQNYQKSPFINDYLPTLEQYYAPKKFDRLAELNIALTKQVCEWLELDRKFFTASELGELTGTKDDHLLAIVEAVSGDHYLSGPAAQAYIQPELWASADIELSYKDYSGYPDYPQISAPFEGAVTILDLLFMVGKDAPNYIWGEHRLRDDA